VALVGTAIQRAGESAWDDAVFEAGDTKLGHRVTFSLEGRSEATGDFGLVPHAIRMPMVRCDGPTAGNRLKHGDYCSVRKTRPD